MLGMQVTADDYIKYMDTVTRSMSSGQFLDMIASMTQA